jgi:hypothetical protein
MRVRFLWTLQLDGRYEVLAYAMAFEAMLVGGRVLVDGLSVSDLRRLANEYWPDGFEGINSEEGIKVLLDEMAGLGLTRPTSPGMYALRNPNVLSLLGTDGEILQQLTAERTVPQEFQAATFRSTYRAQGHPDEARRSPLTAQQENQLLRRDNGVSLVIGSLGTGLADVEPFLELACGEGFLARSGPVQDFDRFDKQISDVFKRRREGTTLLLVSSTSAWSPAWVEAAAERLDKLQRTTHFVRIVFLADPERALRLIRECDPAFRAWTGRGLTLSLERWHDAAVAKWLEDCNLGGLGKGGRDRIAGQTGNWPVLLKEFMELARSRPDQWEQSLGELSARLQDREYASDRLKNFGLDDGAERGILRDLATLGEASTEDLCGVLSGVTDVQLTSAMEWASRLGLVSLSQQGAWRVDGVIARLLNVAGI